MEDGQLGILVDGNMCHKDQVVQRYHNTLICVGRSNGHSWNNVGNIDALKILLLQDGDELIYREESL